MLNPVKIFTFFILMFISIPAFQARTCTAVTNEGNWNQGSTWSCGSAPTNNDTLTIPAGITVNVTCNCGTYSNMVIHVYGTLFFENGQKINMSCNGKIYIHSGGMIDGQNGGSKVVICGNDVYNGNMGPVYGPSLVDQNGIISTLPIELLSFTASMNSESRAEISWVTATETNNDFFTIERTKDGVNYEVVGTVDGAGTSTSVKEYSFVDPLPYPGISYYRLKQTDYDGQFEYSNLVSLSAEYDDLEVTVYPNPAPADAIVIELSGKEEVTMQVVVTDIYGRKCYSRTVMVKDGGVKLAVDPKNKLAPGVYTVTASGNSVQYSQKLIVK